MHIVMYITVPWCQCWCSCTCMYHVQHTACTWIVMCNSICHDACRGSHACSSMRKDINPLPVHYMYMQLWTEMHWTSPQHHTSGILSRVHICIHVLHMHNMYYIVHLVILNWSAYVYYVYIVYVHAAGSKMASLYYPTFAVLVELANYGCSSHKNRAL